MSALPSEDWRRIERELALAIWHKLFCQFVYHLVRLPRPRP
jgi:hypothetical protein